MPDKTNAKICFAISVFLLAMVCRVAGKTIYVDADAAGANNGSSWADACYYLQDALMFAVAGDEIHVAQGIYRPDDFVLSDRPSLGREETFHLINGVAVKGGYAGLGEPDPDARDVKLYETILSGDLNGDDGPAFADNSENCYHVVTGSGTDGTAALDGFTIIAGNAEGDFKWHHRNLNGGGMINEDGHSVVIGCTFRHNHAKAYGAGMWNYGSDPTLINCIFHANQAEGGGGGLYNRDFSSPAMTNCLLWGNITDGWGGGIENYTGCNPTLVNCTISNNTGGLSGGGGMFNYSSNPTLTNCIVWGNKGPSNSVESDSQIAGRRATMNYCCVGGWKSDMGGIGNHGENPLFVDADGADNVAGTADDNLHLLPGSPCLDVADNSALPPSVTGDLDGEPRIANGTVDMGSYEGPRQGLLLSTELITVPEGKTGTFTVVPAMDPLGTIQVTVAVGSGDSDITVVSGAVLTFDSTNWRVPRIVTLAAAQDEGYFNGTALIRISSPGFPTAGVTVNEWDDEAPAILYVDRGAGGANDGTSWADAFADLQDALAVAEAVVQVKEIHVAQGVYKPAGPDGERVRSFELVGGVSVKGGYAGSGGPEPDARDINACRTVLSGDLNGDDIQVSDPCDLPAEQSRAENSRNVVRTPEGADETLVLDGFTITGGNANGICGYPEYQCYGGGLMVYEQTNPTVRNCTFRDNSANSSGGGAYAGRAELTNCRFIHNVAQYGGGCAGGGTVSGCEFTGNFAGHGGGLSGCIEVVNSTFIANSAIMSGGGFSGDTPMTNCTFIANRAGERGGALLNCETLTSCLFIGNSAGEMGGALYSYCYPCHRQVVNCTFTGNRAGRLGGAMYLGDESDRKLRNSILWGNIAPHGPQIAILRAHFDGLSVARCDIEGGQAEIDGYDSKIEWRSGNINVDPCFADPGYWDSNGTPDDANDDFWVDGDYHLKSRAGRWDPNEARWVKDDVTSPCIDAGNPMDPIGPEPFPNGGVVNIGAYGGTSEASKSHFGEPPCETIVAGDINGDCEISFLDFTLMALHWMMENNP
ncbi:MAG: hypothetical protein JSU94_17465 [Phycisphaerales bacterium]|nr:MAG: hypothetical protein JSU94_17465 [Phycisphaerales bacterium]